MRRSRRPRIPRPRLELPEAERLMRAALARDADRSDIHRFLLAHGRSWVPVERPSDVPVGERHDAFRNAWTLARSRDDLSYCEGFTLPRGYDDFPNRHAWCVDGAGAAIDPSPGWADPGQPLRDLYFGVEIPLDFAAPYAAGGEVEKPKGVLFELTGRIERLAAELGLEPAA